MKGWPGQREGAEYVSFYVESDLGARVGYYGCKSSMHLFEYAQGDLGFAFNVVPTGVPWVTKEEYAKIKRYLGPSCEVWVDDTDVARLVSTGTARDFVGDIAEVLRSGVLLDRLPHAERYGPPVEEIVFKQPELERLKSDCGTAT
jgi:hypothetical protein